MNSLVESNQSLILPSPFNFLTDSSSDDNSQNHNLVVEDCCSKSVKYQSTNEFGLCLDSSNSNQQQQQQHQQHSASFQKLNTCGNCEKLIFSFSCFVEYDDTFYHRECFCCNKCNFKFPIDNSTHEDNQNSSMPIKQKNNNKLVCINDFIRSLKCKICSINFDSNSQIFELSENCLNDEQRNNVSNKNDDDDGNDADKLAHVECVVCKMCQKSIQIENEYKLEKAENDENYIIYCKSCTISKNNAAMITQAKKINLRKHRLSSRQKEQIETKLFSKNLTLNQILNENDPIVMNLCKEIGCSKKSLTDYVLKHREKLQTNLNHKQQTDENNQTYPIKSSNYLTDSENTKQQSSIQTMIEELKRLDKILAPNQCPFGVQYSTKRTTNKSTTINYNNNLNEINKQINTLNDITNTLI